MNIKLKIAIYYSGRVEHKKYNENKEKILKYSDKYDVVHFCSLNERGNSEEFIKNFREDFDIGNDQYYIENTIVPDNIKNSNVRKSGNLDNMYSMFYHNYKCIELIEKYQKKFNINFDVIIKYRADIKSNYDLEIENNIPLIENTVYIPEKFDWGGVNDQIAYGNYASMKKYSECYLKFLEISKIVKRFHPESILKAYLSDINIKIYRIKYEYHLNKY